MVIFMGHGQVYDGQHHEDERLQGDDQDVEYRPRPLQRYTQAAQQQQAATEHYGDQDKHQLACIHVAEQSQSQGNRLCHQGHEFQGSSPGSG